MVTTGRPALCLAYLSLAALAAATAGVHRTLIRDEHPEAREEERFPGESECGEATSENPNEPAECSLNQGLTYTPPPEP